MKNDGAGRRARGLSSKLFSRVRRLAPLFRFFHSFLCAFLRVLSVSVVSYNAIVVQ